MKYIKKFLNHVETFDEYSPNTISSYKTTYNQFLDYLNKEIIEVDQEDIEGFIAHLKEKNGGLSRSTINNKLGALRSLYNFLASRGYVEGDPTKDIKRRKPKDKIRNILTRKEVNSLIKVSNHQRDEAIFALLFTTGVRVSELISLNLGDITEMDKGGKIHIRNGKGNKERVVYSPSNYFKYVKRYIEEERKDLIDDDSPSSPLFVTIWSGKRIYRQRINSLIKENVKKTSIDKKVTPHTFRRSCATYMHNKGDASTKMIKEYLGHSDIKTTDRHYIQKYSESQKKSLEIFK